jgi:hypothetical protein
VRQRRWEARKAILLASAVVTMVTWLAPGPWPTWMLGLLATASTLFELHAAYGRRDDLSPRRLDAE